MLNQPTSDLVTTAPCVAELVFREVVILSGSKPNLEGGGMYNYIFKYTKLNI